MPRLPGADRKIKRQGGILRYRTISKGGKYFRIAVTRKSGPNGGRTVTLDRPRKPRHHKDLLD